MSAPHRALTGQGRYVDDVRLPGELHLAVVRSHAAHGRIAAIDVSAALAHPGVVRVVLPADLAPVPRIPTRLPVPSQMEAWFQPVLAEEEVRYVGQPVACVIAEDPMAAEDGAELVAVDVAPLPVAVPEPGVLLELAAGDGPVDDLFARADHVVREEFRLARRTGSPIETRGMVADWSEADGVLRTWGPAKILWFTRRVIAGALGLAEERVVCHRVDVGGMFGTRGEVYPEDVLVAWAAKALGRPVRWIEDRREHMLAMNQSPEELHRFELAVAGDGELLAFRDDVEYDFGAYVRPIGVRLAAMLAENLPGPYRWGGFASRVTCRLSHRAPAGTVRAPSRVGSNFARERAIDLAALRIGMEPLELRRRNLLTAAEMPFERRVHHDETLVYEGGDYAALFDELLERAGGAGLTESVARRRAAGERVGIGVAAFLEGSGVGDLETAAVALEPTGRFRLITAASEVGQGLDETLRAVAAARLPVPATEIDVDSGSTFLTKLGRGTYGSRSTVFAGAAVDGACEQLLSELRAAAAARLGAAPADVALRADGAWDGERHVPWAALAPLRAEFEWRSPGVTFGFGANLVCVSIDPDTSHPVVEVIVAGYDCGRAILPAGVEGQIVGGTVQGLGVALFEDVASGPDGQPQSASFMDYLLPTSADVPPVEAVVWECGDIDRNPLGVRGAGEAGTAGVAAAVGNAVAAALGAPGPRRLPIRPDDLHLMTSMTEHADP